MLSSCLETRKPLLHELEAEHSTREVHSRWTTRGLINHVNKFGCCQESRIPFSFQKDHFEAARRTVRRRMKGEAERLLYEATAVILMRDGGGQTMGGAAVETEKWGQFPARLFCSAAS